MSRGLSQLLPRMKAAGFFAVLAGLLLAAGAAGAFNFPPLTGRIVDQANIIPADTQAQITPKLVDLEQKSGIQLVVATVASLEGQAVEPYANQLFRTWQLGEKEKNNGVLLLIAPNEHKVRIEVGYGLEGTLTDALSNVIITNDLVPAFKKGDYASGISRGVDDIITVLTTDSSEWEKRGAVRLDRPQSADPLGYLLIAFAVIFVILMIVSPGFRFFVMSLLLNISIGSGGASGGGGFSRDDSFGGGFSGGGGSSGGGGASGSW